MAYPLSFVCSALGYTGKPVSPNAVVEHLSFDSRRIIAPATTLFFALSGARDGHDYLDEAHAAGIRLFVVKKGHAISELPNSVIIEVEDTLKALQQLAAIRRDSIKYPLVGITGSNGKTVVKEWLFHLLNPVMKIGRSPKSYNSQIGLPLSVWTLPDDAALGLIEAGISAPNEMNALEAVLRPQIGIITGIGAAHDQGFNSRDEKISEKLKLFRSADILIYPYDQEELRKGIAETKPSKSIGWSNKGQGDLTIEIREIEGGSVLAYSHNASVFIPYKDRASIDNACTCVAFLLAMEHEPARFADGFSSLPIIDMRLQMLNGQYQSRIINDAYSADLSSLEIALEFLKKQAGTMKKTLILSSLFDTQEVDEKNWKTINRLIKAYGVDRVLAVGRDYFAYRPDFGAPTQFYESTNQLLDSIDARWFANEMVLVKGRRDFAFERVVRRLEAQVHETLIEIDLNALEQNFHQYRNAVAKGTKIMAMVKAQGYGSGGLEIARQLQSAGADYLAVAYTDEGIQLRRNGISLPIMVMNAQRNSLEECLDYSLEPVVYDLEFFGLLRETLNRTGHLNAAIHLEFDTGMHRLGFDPKAITELIEVIQSEKRVRIASVFTHLAAADEQQHDAFTTEQLSLFEQLCKQFSEEFEEPPLFHALNTSGIERFPQFAFDMVRPGIGLYGIKSGSNSKINVSPVASLKARITQIKELAAGETIGYSRKGKLKEAGRIAVISIGYADGFPRSLSNGRGQVFINGDLAPVVGNVCMDMVMVDISNVQCKVGDAVEIFGANLPIETLAEWADTIPYEIITGISSRVNRLYFRE